MTSEATAIEPLEVLVVDDDPEALELFKKTLPPTVAAVAVSWSFSPSFDDALDTLRRRRFDILATDIYRDRDGTDKASLVDGDKRAREIIELMRRTRFTPMVLFSDSTLPDGMPTGPFIRFADKSVGNGPLLEEIGWVIQSGVPLASRTLHAELDQIGGGYLWGFLEDRWPELATAGMSEPNRMLGLLRRRASTSFSRLDPSGPAVELASVTAGDYYLIPRIAGEDLRLGDLVRRESDELFGVILTPHCYLTQQAGDDEPRASTALVAWTVDARAMMDESGWSAKLDRRQGELRRRIGSPAQIGRPTGRYWFLPPYLEIPPLYCDFAALSMISVEALKSSEFRLVATLDAPFSEALQSCYLRFYSAVGVPNLDPDSVADLLPTDG